MKREDKFGVAPARRLSARRRPRQLGQIGRRRGRLRKETTYRLGGTKNKVSLGGPVTTGNVTLRRLYDRTRDIYGAGRGGR